MGKQWKQWLTLFWGAPKSLEVVTAAMKLKDAYSWKESYDQPRQHIEKQRHYFINKASGGDGILELFQILEDDAVKVLNSGNSS